MTEDATFEDGRERPLNLGALDADDLSVISSLAQDAVFPITEMKWAIRQRRFAILLNRFRWEDAANRTAQPERVQWNDHGCLYNAVVAHPFEVV